jgi:hypothetical protein
MVKLNIWLGADTQQQKNAAPRHILRAGQL